MAKTKVDGSTQIKFSSNLSLLGTDGTEKQIKDLAEPTLDTDAATKYYVDQVVGGSGLAIQDEGTSVVVSASVLNFIGTDVEAVSGGSGTANIYVPSLAFSAYLTQTNAQTTATIPNVSTSTRLISGPTSEGTPFKIGAWSAGSSQSVTRTSPLVYTPGSGAGNKFSIKNNTSTTITATIYDADGTTPIAQNVHTITGNGTTTVQDITVTITNFTAEYMKYSANLSVSFNMANIMDTAPNIGGRFSVEIEHDNDTDGIFTFTQGPLFYDRDASPTGGVGTAATLTGVSLAETSGQVVTTQLTGVYYYTTGSQFTVDIADIDNANNQSYPSTLVELDGVEYGINGSGSYLGVSGTGLTGWNNSYNDVNDTYQKTNWTISVANFYALTTTGNVSARVNDWSNGSFVNSSNASVAISTFTDNSTRIQEDFRNETKRWEADLATAWDNTQDLNSYTGNTDGLQVANSRLIYPSVNYTAYNPNTGSQPNYSSFTGDRTFIRSFWKTSTAFSNILLQFGDYTITESDITAQNVKIEWSLDGTNWYLGNVVHDGTPLTNGDGNRIFTDTNALNINNRMQFTFATFSTGASTGDPDNGWGVWMKITIKAAVSSRYIGLINVVDWV